MRKLPNEIAVFILLLLLPKTGNSQGADSLQIKNESKSLSPKIYFSFRLITPVTTLKLPVGNLNDTLRNLRNDLIEAAHNFLKNPIAMNTASINYESKADRSYLLNGSSYYFNNLDISSDWTVANIPVVIGFQDQSWTDVIPQNLNKISFQFDRENYLMQLKKKLTGKFDPSSLLNSVKNPFGNILQDAKQSLFSELKELNDSYKGLLSKEMDQIRNLPDLFETNGKSLREKFLNPAFLLSVAQKQRLLAGLQQRINNGEKINAEELSNLQDDLLKMKGIQELIKKVELNKAKWDQSGLLKKLKEFDLLNKKNISKFINDPSSIVKLARQKLSLSGLQRIFLNVNHLNIGQNVLSLSPLSLQHFLSKGISTEFLSNNRSLTFVAGRQTDFNSILDYPFTNSVISNTGIAKMFRVGSGIGTKSTTNLSVSSFSQSMSGLINQVNPSIIRQVLVTTISNQLSMGEKGMINVELSRSATQYDNRSVNDPGSSLQGKNNLSRIFSTDNFMANTAVSLKYFDEYSEQGLAYNISFSKVSNGYTNPGNSYLSTGTTEFGMGVRKSLMKNKILLSFRGNSKVYKYNDKIDASWRNIYMLFDAKWKMKKGQYVAIRYQPVKMTRMEDGLKTPVSSVERITAETNFYKKSGKISYRNFISLTGQKNLYPVAPNIYFRNTSLAINSFQNIMIGRKMIYININYNHTGNSTQYLFLNSSLYTEAGYSYQLNKNITASTGFIYNSIEGWYSQAGVRQTISGQLGKKFSINLYADAKKNLKIVQPLWDGPIRADISLRYILKNKN